LNKLPHSDGQVNIEHAADLSEGVMRAGTTVQEDVRGRNIRQNSGSADRSMRDKKSADDIVSSKNHPGGAPS
jgi:hypothetical protein